MTLRYAALWTAMLAGCGGVQEAPVWSRPGLESAVRPEMGPPQPGDAAPDFALPRLDGTVTRLSALRGTWVLLHFTASWCPFCDAEVEHLGELASAYAEHGVTVVLVDVKEGLAHWQEYARAHVDARVFALWDGDGAATARYAPPRALPSFDDRSQVMLDSTLIVDPEGTIRLFVLANSKHFDPTFAAVRRELDAMLDANPTHSAATRTASAQEPAALSPEEVARIAVVPIAPVASGGRGELRLSLDIAEGYHVMSNTPSDPLYIATRVTMPDGDGITWGEARYPPAQSFRLLQDTISTFAGNVPVTIPFDVADEAAPGPRRVTASVRYQSCTSSNCLFPVTREVEVQLQISP